MGVSCGPKTSQQPEASSWSRSLLLYKPRDLRWVNQPLAPLGPRGVRLETLAGAVSVGTELPLYRGDALSAAPPHYPLMTGYESLARVREVGAEVAGLEVGARVVATYGHRTAACLPAAHAIPVPEDIPDEIALLSVLSNDASKGVGKLRLSNEHSALITGAGTIGLLALHRLRWLGLERVDVVEPRLERRKLARKLGARSVFTPETLPAEAHYDAGVECSSAQAAFALLQRHLKANGQLCVLADGNVEPLTLTPDFHARELNVVASSDGDDYPGHAAALFAHWREAKTPLAQLFTWRIVAADLPAVFEKMLEERPLKMFVSYR